MQVGSLVHTVYIHQNKLELLYLPGACIEGGIKKRNSTIMKQMFATPQREYCRLRCRSYVQTPREHLSRKLQTNVWWD